MVLLDTPPCHQVIDFFESPARLQKFFSGREDSSGDGWFRWVQERGIQVAERFLKTLVGKEFVEEMDMFFRSVGDLKTKIYETSEQFLAQMKSERSSVQLIFPPSRDKVEDAIYLNREISRNGFQVDGYILNRAYPISLDFSEELEFAADGAEKSLYNYYMNMKPSSRNLLKNFEAQNNQGSVVMIPEFSQSIMTKDDIMAFSDLVAKHWETFG